MRHLFYKTVGGAYMALALPSLIFVALGELRMVSPFYTLALGGLPLGAMLTLFGTGKFPINRMSNMALTLGVAALFGVIPLFIFGSFAGFFALASALATATVFAMAAVSLLAFLFTIFAILHNHRRPVSH